MYKFFNSSSVIYSLLTSMFLFLLYYIFWSSFYFDSEYVLNPILSGQCGDPITLANSYADPWRLLNPIFSLLFHKNNSIEVYNVFNFIVVFIIFFLINHAFRLIFSSVTKNKLVLISLVVFLVMTPYLLEINNKFIAFLLVICSFLYYRIYVSNQVKWYKYVAILSLVFALVCRTEITLFALFFVSVFSFFFERKILIEALMSFSFVFVFFFTYLHFQDKYSHEESVVLSFESESQDRWNQFITNDLSQIDSLKRTALFRFVQDPTVIGGLHEKLLIGVSKFSASFITSSKNLFILNYNRIIQDLKKTNNFFYVFYFAFLIFTSIKLLIKSTANKNKIHVFKYWIFSIFILAVILFTSFYIHVPVLLFNLILSMFFIYILYDSIKLTSEKCKKVNFIYFVVFILSVFIINRNNSLYIEYERKNDFGKSVWQMIENIDKEGKIPVFANVFDFNYSCKLDIINHSKYIEHYYLDMQIMSASGFYKSYSSKFFGPNYNNLIDRLDRIKEEDVVFISNDSYMDFLKAYTLKYHDIEIQESSYKNFEVDYFKDSLNFKAYSINLSSL